MAVRIESDTMGELEVPEQALYGAQTARAVANFPISGSGIGRAMIGALGLVKKAAAMVNRDLGKLERTLATVIINAAEEVVRGDLDAQFPVDLFQTGSGTSSNMNANEVIANRAIQLLGGELGSKTPVHPNDHVNMGQSSNDVFPTALHVAALTSLEQHLLPVLGDLRDALAERARAFDHLITIGRTHLQDATPIRIGQVLSGYAAQVELATRHLQQTGTGLAELAIGGTAVGTGLNTHHEFGQRMAATLADLTGVAFVEAANHFEAQSARDAAVRTSGALKALAVSLIKIANDLRWLASGPRLGLGELRIPPVQPGSSIMPGKVNPVIAEALIQVAVQVIGNDAAIAWAGVGQLQLNAMQPLIARNLLEQLHLLTNGVAVFTSKLVRGLEVNHQRIETMVEQSLSMATALAPVVGYDTAAEIAKEADLKGQTVRQVAYRKKVLPPEQLDTVLDPWRQTEPDR